jgi:chaperonin cofactor prefoldin
MDFNIEEIKPYIHSIVRESVNKIFEEKLREESHEHISNYQLFERVVRVEEELKNQREIITLFMKQVDKRFEEMQHYMDKRFEQIDKRFDQIDKRFEQIDKRFEFLTSRIDRFMVWSLGITLSSTFLIIGYMHYFIK